MSNGEFDNRHLSRWKSVTVLGVYESHLYLASIHMLRLKSKILLNPVQSCSKWIVFTANLVLSSFILFGKQSGPERIWLSLVLFLRFLKIKFLK